MKVSHYMNGNSLHASRQETADRYMKIRIFNEHRYQFITRRRIVAASYLIHRNFKSRHISAGRKDQGGGGQVYKKSKNDLNFRNISKTRERPKKKDTSRLLDTQTHNYPKFRGEMAFRITVIGDQCEKRLLFI